LATKIQAKKIKEENGVTGSMILITFFVTALALLLTLPNIYLDNQIYYESSNIAHYQRIKITLEEEQTLIKNRLEEINYKENLLNHDIK
jgi:competence protein ComGC